MNRFLETTTNQFFKNNALKPLARSTSYSKTEELGVQNPIQSSNKAKKSSSSVAKINPKKFVQREVFNTKLYQAPTLYSKDDEQKNLKKFFQISLNKQERIEGAMGDQQGVFLKQINNKMHCDNYYDNKALQSAWKHLHHHFSVLERMLRTIDHRNPFKITVESINQFLQSFLTLFTRQHDKALDKIKQFNLNITSLNRKRSQSVAEQIFTKTTQNNFSSIRQKIDNESAIKNQVHKQNVLEFQNKKLILFCEKLEEDLRSKAQQLNKKTTQCQNLIEQFKKNEKQRQAYQFKIKKLKEELEVAHIIKQQNLADKVNYILGWKL